MNGARTESQSDLLRSFLASHDEACPGCGYNLRGATAAQCPECGRELSLAIRAPRGVGRRRGLLLLLFAWLLLAGSMNSYRTGRAVYQTASAWQQVMWTNVQLPPGMPPLVTGRRSFMSTIPATGVSFDINTRISGAANAQSDGGDDSPEAAPDEAAAPAGPAALDISSLTASQITFDTTGTIIASGPTTMRLSTSSVPGMQWSRVRWTQWAAAGWWTALSLAAAGGLVLLLAGGRRLSDCLSTWLVITAWVAFAGYFTYHALHFLRDIL